MWLVPFLAPFKAPPIASFHSEALAAAFGMLALSALPAFALRLYLPRIALLPLLFTGLILVHLVLGRVPYQQAGLLGALYLLWTVALILLGGLLRRELGLERVAGTLAWFLLCGAAVSAVIGWAQHIESDALSGFMMPRSHDRVWGNLGQANHLGDYLALGLVSTAYLYATGKLRVVWALALAAALVYVLQLTGSRASLLYLTGSIALAGTFFWLERSQVNRRLLGLSIYGLIAFFCIPWLTSWSGAIERLRDSSLAFDERPRIWKAALSMFSDAPLLGVGFRQFGYQHFVVNGTMPEPRVIGFTDNAHNVFLQVMAEFGLAGLIVLVSLAVLWVLGMLRQPRTPAQWWLWALALVVAVHSLLEYPLWYAFFLGVGAIVLGLGDSHGIKLQLSGRARTASLILVAVLAIGWFTLGQLFRDYLVLESFLAFRHRYMDAGAEVNRNATDALLKLRRASLLAPYVELGLARTIRMDADHLADKLVVNGRAMRLFPVEDVVYRHAMLLGLRGEQAQAQRQWDLAAGSYPEESAIALELMRRRVAEGLTQMLPLLEYAREYDRKATRAKGS